MLQKLRTLLKEKGQGIVEYAMILGFVAVIAIALLGNDDLLEQVSQSITNITEQAENINSKYNEY